MSDRVLLRMVGALAAINGLEPETDLFNGLILIGITVYFIVSGIRLQVRERAVGERE